MNNRDITIGIVGSGGDGVVTAGDILIKAAAHEGLNCMMIKSFGPQIRGGESSCRLRLSDKGIYSPGNNLEILVVLSWADYRRFSGELDVEEEVIIIMDDDDHTYENDIPVKEAGSCRLIKVPFSRLAGEIKNPRAKNMVMLGVIVELFGLPKKGIGSAIEKKFGRGKEGLIEANIGAYQAGVEYVKKNFSDFDVKFSYSSGSPKFVLTGDEAIAFGALAAGCKFFSSYPITPASEIMEWLGTAMPRTGGVLVQAEDEISAVCMVVGASYGGVRAMSATSGPGVSLMLETIGLGSMAEIPFVIVNVQRGGPSTGMPTKSEQADLSQAIFGMHGDAPHAVIAASDVEDCFRATMEAFNIAEYYQMPVILLSDQFLGHRTETVEKLDFESVKIVERLRPKKLAEGGYKRFADTPDGISPTTWPGIRYGEFIASGIEHDEYGAPASTHFIHEKMSAKRARKLDHLSENFKFIRRYGAERPEIGVIAWGSNKGVAREAVEYFYGKGLSVGAIVPQLLYPIQEKIFRSFLDSVKTLVVIENSYSGQFVNYLKSSLDLPERILSLRSSGSRFFTVREVIGKINEAL